MACQSPLPMIGFSEDKDIPKKHLADLHLPARTTVQIESCSTAAWATRGLAEETGAQVLESSLVPLKAAGSGERHATPPEKPRVR